VVLNEAGVFTTDTIYRGRLLDPNLGAATVAAGFHSSLTLLSAELEGRSFGGGVLELVPSEVGRLAIHPGDARRLGALDAIGRTGGADALIAAPDADLVAHGLVEADVMAAVSAARRALLARRLARDRRVAPPAAPAQAAA
jgi:adenine-specific DNA-methyltransferase